MDLFFWTDKQFGTIKMYSIKKRTNNFFYKLNQMELYCETFYKKTFFSINCVVCSHRHCECIFLNTFQSKHIAQRT